MAEPARTGIGGLVRNIQDNRASSKMRDASKMADIGKANAAEGVGGTLVTESGKEIPGVPTGATAGMTSNPKSTMGKIGHAIGSGAKALFGFKRGGQITKSGVAYVHKGEHIIPSTQTVERKALRQSTRRSGRR